MAVSAGSLSKMLNHAANKHVRGPFAHNAPQKRNLITPRAAYEDTAGPGMRQIDPQTSSRTMSATASSSSPAKPSTPVSYRVSLFDAMKFTGAPERVNGRLAMAMFIIAALKENSTGMTFLQILQNPDWPIVILAGLIMYGTMVPVLRGCLDEDFYMFSVRAEKVNGRLAMLGWAGLIALEELYAHACFF